MRGYVKDADEHTLYKVDLPDDADELTLNEGESFVAVETIEALDAIEMYQAPIVKTDEQKKAKLISEKMRELAVTELKAEGKLDEDGNLVE